MTKRLMAVALCVAASLAVGGVAQAQGLSARTAQKLAKRLARKQVRDRDIVSFHISKGKRLGADRIAFAYDDRSARNVYCTALLTVRLERKANGGGRIVARFSQQKCAGIPAAALAFESITRNTERAMRSSAVATADAVHAFNVAFRPCKRLRVPRARVAAANELLGNGLTEALEQPNDGALGDFVAALGRVSTGPETRLAAGAAAWADYLAVLRALPALPDPCGDLRTWAKHGWSAGAAPADFATLRALDRRAVADQRTIVRAANRLAVVGVSPPTVLAFTPKGLLLGLAPKIAITGGR